ncbi:carbohydrate porin [Dyella sp.]|uniref:carbohydrate porin n=1 Tax=Dyella sp. TaxID=1869338 RepID=UPI002ED18AEF
MGTINHSCSTAIAACLLAWATLGPVHASDAAPQEDTSTPVATPKPDWWHGQGFLGDWGGERSKLHREGVDFFGNFQVQSAAIVHGGKQRGIQSNHQIVVGTKLDLDKLLGISHAGFTFAVSDRFGSNASNLAGTRVIINSNYGEGENFRLANLSFNQSFYKGRLSYQLGWFPAAAEFDYNPLLCSFLNQGFCGHPNSLGADSGGFQNPPGAQLGARITGYILPDVYLKVGVFDVNPSLYINNSPGFHLGTSGDTGTIYLTELGWSPHVGEQGLPGNYKIGGYYDTSKAPDVVNPKRQREGRSNGWISIDQMVWSPGDTHRGLILFANLTQADKTNAQIESYDSAGIVFQGPFASRPQDIFSLGWAKSNLNTRKLAAEMRGRPTGKFYGAEEYIDMSYRFQINAWLFLTPDVQYLMNPGAFSAAHYRNATVVGGELAIKF